MFEHFERWLPVIGYEGLYEVSNCGRVRSLGRYLPHNNRTIPGRVLTPVLNGGGYLCVNLFSEDHKRNHLAIAHLVAAAWIGPRPGGLQIDHKDGNKQNNAKWNLRYLTHKENANAGNFKFHPPHGETHRRAKFSDADVIEIRRLSMEGMRRKDLAKMFGVKSPCISRIVLRQRRVQ